MLEILTLVTSLAAAQPPAPAPSAHAGTRAPAAAPQAGRGVVVFPFENLSEDRSLYWVSEAIADGVMREIRRSGGEVFDRDDRVAIIEELGVPTLSVLTLASQIKSAEELGAAALVTGTFGAQNGLLSVRARVIDLTAGRTGSWLEVQGSTKDVFAVQTSLAMMLRPALAGPARLRAKPRLDQGPPEDGSPQTAYEYLVKSFFEDVPAKREILLRRALDIAPDYLRAQIEMARIAVDANDAEKASAALSRIVTRDRSLAAEAENLLAEIELQRDHSDAAESAVRRSLASYETARAHLLLARIAAGRSDLVLAKSEIARARALDPRDPDLAEVEESLTAPRE